MSIGTKPESTRPYDTYPNVRGHTLSYGEIRDFNNFQDWLKGCAGEFQQEHSLLKGTIGTDEMPVVIKVCTDPCRTERNVSQIILDPGGLIETRFTLTGDGLLEETFLPGETEPDSRILDGKTAAMTLNHIKENLHK